MDHNKLTFEALKDAIATLTPPPQVPKIVEHKFMAGMGNKLVKTDYGFFCSPEFFQKAKTDWDALMKEEIFIIELPKDKPIDIGTAPDFLSDELKLWKL